VITTSPNVVSCFFCVCIFLYMPCVQFIPSSKYYTIFHCILTMSLISSMKDSKHFSIFNWYLDVQRIFKYVMIIIKQSCGQFKYVYILNDVYFNNWIGNYTYWMYLIWCIFHHVKSTWLNWWLSKFPCEHHPYFSIFLVASCS